MQIKFIKTNGSLPSPQYQTPQAAGMDLCANINTDITLKHMEIKLIPTGIKVQLPSNYEMQVRPRSGLAAKHGVTVLNAPGTIDADFRGEIQVILINLGREDFIIHKGDRIAQAVISKIYQADMIEVKSLDETVRGEGGFGSTGTGISNKINNQKGETE